MVGRTYRSWGLYSKAQHHAVHRPFWRDEVPDLSLIHSSVLPYGYGRSYGDSCLNDGGVLLDVASLNRFISFDPSQGTLRCEAGVTLRDVLDLVVPRGWFLPVTPGTKYVSIAGAIANDVHGKNHHRAGTFGCHVTCFELLRSNGEHLICSNEQNRELFRATIGGLGLTGLILWAEIRLKKISTSLILRERLRFSNLSEFFELSKISDERFEYTVAWIDCLNGGRRTGRGAFIRGNHSEADGRLRTEPVSAVRFPFALPSLALNTYAFKAFNVLYYLSQSERPQEAVSYEPFFYPLDGIEEWNRAFGKSGFLQYQCVVPPDDERAVMAEIMRRISRSGEGSVLAVLKKFGDIQSPGILSFPQPGTTLALDFPYRSEQTLRLLEELDEIVRDAKGAVYPAKDARMSGKSFRQYFPQWQTLCRYVDPKFSSSFWRRVVSE